MRCVLVALVLLAVGPSALAESPDESKATTCNAPVYMVVQGKNRDREKYRAYGEALRDSQLYPKTGGYYIAKVQPIEMFEGDWEKENFQVIVRFPCHQAARDFWYSDTYKELKKLREGAGEVIVGIFPEVPVSPWATWAIEED